ncbi:MAG: hypothetical protein HOI53_00025 [Francisellaceae bacterium]|jgi:hypothetical protein|nr:hypothetical protein [Francisellaceae bacterium]MBT6206385.1 hypothetical protein [Francisellaceae bacterium]MBT6538705.1 hypothetical protein [Francisellaceae bacterium]
MSTNSYLPEPNELSAVSLHFFESRLQIKLIMLTMNMLSLILASLVMLVFQTNGNISYNSIFFVIFAYVWLFHRKKVQQFFVRQRYRKAISRNPEQPWSFHVTKYKIKGQVMANDINIKWTSIRKIYYLKNLHGYMIPLTGLKNSGRFIWLPNSGFNQENDLLQFKQFLIDNKIKIKKR